MNTFSIIRKNIERLSVLSIENNLVEEDINLNYLNK